MEDKTPNCGPAKQLFEEERSNEFESLLMVAEEEESLRLSKEPSVNILPENFRHERKSFKLMTVMTELVTPVRKKEHTSTFDMAYKTLTK